MSVGIGVPSQRGLDVGEAERALRVGQHDHVVDVGHELAGAVQRLMAAGHREQAPHPRARHPLQGCAAAPRIDDVDPWLAGEQRPQRAQPGIVDIAAATRQQADARRDIDCERRGCTQRQFLRRRPLGDSGQIGRRAQHHAEIAGQIDKNHITAGALGTAGSEQGCHGVADAALGAHIGIDHWCS